MQDFQKKYPGSIKSAKVGFMAPEPEKSVNNPTYRQVCSGESGHVEVLYVELNDPCDQYYEPLVRFFFQFHDPTTKNQQGNDVGQQYGSVIFCDDEQQKEIATRVKNELQELVTSGKVTYVKKTVTTDIVPTSTFFPAHEEHQVCAK